MEKQGPGKSARSLGMTPARCVGRCRAQDAPHLGKNIPADSQAGRADSPRVTHRTRTSQEATEMSTSSLMTLNTPPPGTPEFGYLIPVGSLFKRHTLKKLFNAMNSTGRLGPTSVSQQRPPDAEYGMSPAYSEFQVPQTAKSHGNSIQGWPVNCPFRM